MFDFGRGEVRSFLLSNACFWLDWFHADGLRVDAVSALLYYDFCRENGEWLANPYGGRENLDAIAFLRKLNATVYHDFPGRDDDRGRIFGLPHGDQARLYGRIGLQASSGTWAG